jgi:hypothetical protein
MISRLKSFLFGTAKTRTLEKSPGILTAVDGDRFGWPAGRILTALDPVVIVLPKGLLSETLPLSDALDAHDEIAISIPDDGDVFYIRLRAGMWASLRRSCQAMISGDEGVVYRFRLAVKPQDVV